MRGKQELQLFLWNWCGLLQIAFVQWYLWRTDHYSFEVKFCETEPNEDCSCPLVSWRPSLLEVTTPTCHVSNSLFHPDVCAAQDPTNSTWLCITQHPSTQPGNVRFQRPWNAFAVWSRWWKSWAMWRVDAYGAVPGCWGAMYGSKEMCMKVVSYCMILENYVINWHLFLIAMTKLGNSPPPTRPMPVFLQVLEVFRATTTDWKGPMSSIAMRRPSAFGIFTWRSWAPGTIFRGVGLKGSEFKRLVFFHVYIYIWYIYIISFVERRSICV